MAEHDASASPSPSAEEVHSQADRPEPERIEVRPRPRLPRIGRGAVALVAVVVMCFLVLLTLRTSRESLDSARERPAPPGPPPVGVERIERYEPLQGPPEEPPAPEPPSRVPAAAPPLRPTPDRQQRSDTLQSALRSDLLGGTGRGDRTPRSTSDRDQAARGDLPSFAELSRDLLAGQLARSGEAEGPERAHAAGASPAARNLLPSPDDDTPRRADLRPLAGGWTLDAGTYVPAILTHRVVSDQPGQVRAVVTRDVLDSRTASRVLLPRGSYLLGRQASLPSLGQRRLAIVWHRVLLPDGRSLELGTTPSAARDGSAGIPGRVNSHWSRRFGAAVLLSLVGAGLQLSQPQRTAVVGTTMEASPGEVAAGALGLELGRLSQDLLRRYADLPPTVELRAGARVHAVLTADLVFPHFADRR